MCLTIAKTGGAADFGQVGGSVTLRPVQRSIVDLAELIGGAVNSRLTAAGLLVVYYECCSAAVLQCCRRLAALRSHV